MRKIFLTISIALCLGITTSAQKPFYSELRVGLNNGAYDHYNFYDFKAPILFAEYNIRLKSFLYVTPFVLSGSGRDQQSYTANYTSPEPFTRYSVSTTFHGGLLFKLVPFPKRFDNFRFVQGITYFYEEQYMTTSNGGTYSYGRDTGRGWNYTAGIDIDFLKWEYFRVGGDIRLNTSDYRELTMYTGLNIAVVLKKSE